MVATAYTTGPHWSASARYTASGETPVKINNPDRARFAAWTITASDAVPAIAVALGNLIAPRDTDRLTLAAGERLWLAVLDSRADGQASIET